MIIVAAAQTRNNFGGKGYLTFENITSLSHPHSPSSPVFHSSMRVQLTPRSFISSLLLIVCPIQLSLIDPSLLTASEKNWLNAYHRQCRALLSPLVEGKAKEWLERSCVDFE